ncbi:hypothetical protein SDC9_206692 [bioreactor metagenome]|uniref:Uncharacterized protein n=1 Tax=bioreactor metagenome TaxID=1076179 RepID=A0A645J5H5_9ZZZZ
MYELARMFGWGFAQQFARAGCLAARYADNRNRSPDGGRWRVDGVFHCVLQL